MPRHSTALQAAIQAYRNLLGAYPRDQVPLDWARTQNNLGSALARFGERESGTEWLEETRSCIEDAWHVYKDAGMDQYDEEFRRRLAALDRLITERR